MIFAGYQILECRVSFDELPSLLVECCPTYFEGWEVVEDSNRCGYWFRSNGVVPLLSRNAFRLINALCDYVECDHYVWSKDDALAIHFRPERIF